MCSNRLLLVGPTDELKRFGHSRWANQAGARHIELLECSANRLALQFDSEQVPLAWLRKAAGQRPSVVLLLDFENEDTRTKGLAKAHRDNLDVFTTHY